MIKSFLNRGKPVVTDSDKSHIVVNASRQSSRLQARRRILTAMAAFTVVFGVFGGRLTWLALQDSDRGSGPVAQKQMTSRPDIVDRNGKVLATDITTASLYAEPNRIVDVDEAIEALVSVLPDLNFEKTYKKLSSDSAFAWLKREVTPTQQSRIHQLGLPGIGFRSEKRRFYPGGSMASHILGHVNIDNRGIAGMEKYIDDQGLAALQMAGLANPRDLAPVRLSIDSRIQHIVHEELAEAMKRYRAIAAGAVVLDANTGEVVAMSSLPDYDPNTRINANKLNYMNRMTKGVYEMGSTFKSFTTAMALDSGLVRLHDRFDARKPLRFGRFTIRDFHGKNRVLSVPEIFIYSSNIGTAKMADKVGTQNHRAFIQKMHLLDVMKTQLPEVARPTEPKQWKKLHSITISYGHGMATTPLQTAVAGAALLNGGRYFPPTFLPRTREEAIDVGEQVLKARTSLAMRYLFRLNVEKGSGRRSKVPGYFIGGKTGTAEKVINGRYSSKKRFNAFLSGFPANNPQYVVLVILDEPKGEKPGQGATAGMNAGPTVARIIRRSAPIMGVRPAFYRNSDMLMAAYR